MGARSAQAEMSQVKITQLSCFPLMRKFLFAGVVEAASRKETIPEAIDFFKRE